MKIRRLFTLLFAASGLFFVNSCIKKPVYPSEPVITYKDFIRYGNDPSNPDSVEIVVGFTDNEGDVGLYQYDTTDLFKKGNIWFVYYYDSTGNDTWSPVDDSLITPEIDTFKFGYRIPPVLPDDDPYEPVKGSIYAKIKPFVVIDNRIKFEIYMYDRAMHKSNVIETPPIEF